MIGIGISGGELVGMAGNAWAVIDKNP